MNEPSTQPDRMIEERELAGRWRGPLATENHTDRQTSTVDGSSTRA